MVFSIDFHHLYSTKHSNLINKSLATHGKSMPKVIDILFPVWEWGKRHSHFKPSWVTQLLFPWFYPQRCWDILPHSFSSSLGSCHPRQTKTYLGDQAFWRSITYNDLSGRQPKMSAEVILNSGHSEFIANLPVAVVQRRTGWWGSSMMWWNWAWCEETDVELLLGDSHDHLGMFVASKREPHSTISWSMSVFKSKGFEFGLSKSFIYSFYLSS